MLLSMGTRAIYDHDLHAHFVTFSCYRRRRLLDHDRAKRVVLGVLHSQLAHRKASCVGFVVMPDHVHAIVWFPIPGQLSVFIQQWKRLSSHHIGQLVRSRLVHYAEKIGDRDPFWQAKYSSFNLYSEEKVREKLTHARESGASGFGDAAVRLGVQLGTVLRAAAERGRADSLDRVTASCA